MLKAHLALLLFVVPLVTFAELPTFAYENTYTHPLITRKGINLLAPDDASPYAEFRNYSAQLLQGSQIEDEPVGRVLTHFYNPVTKMGFNLTNTGVGSEVTPLGVSVAFPSSFQEISSDVLIDDAEGGSNWWKEALQLYSTGQKKQAYVILGRIAHLATEDAAQPAHIHNDPHLSLSFSIPILNQTIPTKPSSYESYVEGFAEKEDIPDGTQVAEAFTYQEIMNATANSTYLLSQFSKVGSGFNIQIGNQNYNATFVSGVKASLIPMLQIDHFEIQGETQKVLWAPSIKEGGSDGNLSRLFGNDWWSVPESSDTLYYFHPYDQMAVDGNNDTLNQYYMQQCIPIAINHTAGLLKVFAQVADPFPPLIELKNSDDYILAPGTTIYATDISVDATDPSMPGFPTPSGIYRISLNGPVSNTYSFSGLKDGSTGSDAEFQDFSGLTAGSYIVSAFDGLGNGTSVQFNVGVDTSPPTQIVTDSNNSKILDGDVSTDPNMTVSADDHGGSGVAWVELDPQSSATSIGTQPQPDGVAPTFDPKFPSLADDSYCATSYDVVDNDSSPICFEVCTDPDGCACKTDPNSSTCQKECAKIPAACESACKKDARSSVCKDFCFNHPNDPVCLDECAKDSTLPYCNPSCQFNPLSPACQNYCQTHPLDALCQKLCGGGNGNPAYCPPGGGGNNPSVGPGSGGGPQSPRCDPPITFTYYFSGGLGDCYHVIGGPTGCIKISGTGKVPVLLTATKIGLNIFNTVVSSHKSGLSSVEHLAIYVHGCRPDPTFLGGNEYSFDLPEPTTPLIDAFSPGVTGSPNPKFTETYVVFGAQAEVFVLVRNSSGTLVRSILSGDVEVSGSNQFIWDGRDDAGVLQPEGYYTYTVAQQALNDPSQSNVFSGYVAIENHAPVAQLTEPRVDAADETALDILGTATDPYLRTYQIDRATSAAGPFTLTALSSQASTTPVLATMSRSYLASGTNVLRLTVTNAAMLTATASETLVVNTSTAGLHGVPVQVGASSQTVLNPTGFNPPADNPNLFLEDALPASGAGVSPALHWAWVPSPVYSGSKAHTDDYTDSQAGARLHYFTQANPGRLIALGENIIQYVYLDPVHPPKEILLGFYTDQGNGEHRVYWGDNLIQTGGTPGTASLLNMGALPGAGGWVRLKIPARLMNLEGKSVAGMVFGAYGGRATWDKTTTSMNAQDSQAAAAAPISTASGFDSVSTSLTYTLPRAAHLRLDVFNATTGAFVKNIGDSVVSSGTYTVSWNQTDAANGPAPDGDYFFKFSSPDGPIDSEAIVLAGTSTVTTGFAASVSDADHNVYQLNAAIHQITKTSTEGFLLTTIPTGTGSTPSGIALDSAGNLLLATSSGAVRYGVGQVDFGARTLSANIRIPWDNALVRATVPIIGGASGRTFSSYTVDVAPTWIPSSFTVLNQGHSQVLDDFVFPDGNSTIYGNLATWETGLVGGEEYPTQDLFHPPVDRGYHGRWTIRLRTDGTDGTEAVSERKVIIGRVVNNATGGVIVSDDSRARIKVPPLALQEDWAIFGLLQSTTTPPAYQPALPPGVRAISPIYELMPAGYAFKQPTQLQIAVTSSDLFVGGKPITASQVGMYVYNPTSGQWDRQSAGPSVVVDTTTGITETVFTNPALTTIPNFDGFYALFADTSTLAAPVLSPIPATTSRQDVFVSGIAAPQSTVELFFVSGSTSATTVRAAFPSDAQGNFAGDLVFPGLGTYGIAATATDAFGNQSGLSASQTIKLLNSVPSQVTSVAFKDVAFSSAALSVLQKNSPVYLELHASDIDPSRPDTVYVVLSSSKTNPSGIPVALTQIDNTSGIYRGSAYLGDVTDAGYVMLAAMQNGEAIHVAAQSNPAVQATLPLGDFTLPAAPRIFSPTHPASFQDTFENGPSEWATFNSGTGAQVTLDSGTASTGQTSIQVQQTTANGDFSTLISNRPFDVRTTPTVSFDYQFPNPIPRFSMYFRRNGVWHQVQATETNVAAKNLPPTFVPIGNIMPVFENSLTWHVSPLGSLVINGDNHWHHAEFNLLPMFENLYPNDTSYSVDEIMLADFNQTEFYGMVPGNNPVGDSVHFDNFMVRAAGSSNRNPFFTWQAPQGNIAGYSYTMDASSTTTPPPTISGRSTAASFSGVANGLWYFHVRAENAQGVWGPANHYAFRVDSTPPTISSPTPAPALPLTRTGQTTAVVHLVDESGIDPASLAFSVNGAHYSFASGGVTFDVATGSLTIALGGLTPAPVLHDGDIVTMSIDNLADLAGNHIAQPFAWSWQMDLSGALGGGFGPVTFNGGKDASWSHDSQRLAFASNRFGNDDLFVVTAQGGNVLVESSATLTRVTSSAANENQPTWSPDGARLAFVSDATGRPQLWMVPSNASAPAVQLSVSQTSDTHPTWSSDGREIYFARSTSGLGNLWAIDIDTHTWAKTGEHQVTQSDIGFDLEPAVSPDGLSIVYHRSMYTDSIERVAAGGLNTTSLTASGSDVTPAWSPDGSQVVFSTQRTSSAKQLWLMNATGSNPRLLLDNNNTWPETEPAWSPDGGRIAFTTTRSGSPNIWVLSVLSVGTFAATPPVFSPAGSSVTAKKSITFSYPLSASNAVVSLDILKAGAAVTSLLHNVTETGGTKTVIWNGQVNGTAVADGIYTARLTVTGPAALDPIVRQVTFTVASAPPGLTLTNTTGGNGPSLFFNPGTVFALQSNGQSPVSEIDLAIDATTQFKVAPSTFSLVAGNHTLAFRALDAAGNLSAPIVETVGIDDAPPISSVTYHGPFHVGASSQVYVAAITSFTITSVDASTSAVVSGIYLLTAGADDAVSYTGPSPFALGAFGPAEGTHDLIFYSQDRAGNSESQRSVIVFVDQTPPAVTYSATPPLFSNGVNLYASTSTVFGIVAQDPFSSGDASGLSQTFVAIDTGAFVSKVSTFSITALGSHGLKYYAVDQVGNTSAVQTLSVIVQSQGPTGVINVSGPSYVAGMSAGATTYAGALTRFSLSVSSGAPPASGFNVSIDSGALHVLTSTQTISFATEGRHTIQFAAVRGGVAEVSETYRVFIDTTPPVSAMTFGAGSYGSFVRPDTLITLSSSDSVSGLASTTYILDGSTIVYTAPFTFAQAGLASGTHTIQWYATDHVSNVEHAHRVSLTVDSSAPTTVLSLTHGKQYTDGIFNYASGDAVYVASATDVGAGIAQVFVDSGTGLGFQLSTGTIGGLSGGLHTFTYYAVDHVGNSGVVGRYSVYVDTVGPSVSSSATIPTYSFGGVIYARESTEFAITTAADNLSGLATVTILADGAPATSPVRFLTEGAHTLQVTATDRVGNSTAPPLHLSFDIDGTPPITQVVPSTSAFVNSAGIIYVSSRTTVALVAHDSGTTPSGVAFTQDSVDTGTLAKYSQALSLAAGLHTVKFQSQDNVGNLEVLHISSVAVDATPPTTKLSFSTATIISNATVFTLAATDPLTNGVASGVAQTLLSKDGGAFVKVTAPFSLTSSGTHTLAWHSLDAVGNSEVVQSTSLIVFIDTAPPVTQLGFSTSTYTGASGQVYLSSSTTLHFSASDFGKPLTGVTYTQYAVDASTTFIRYTSPFVLAEGLHTVKFQSRDNNGNLETLHISTVAVDATPPATTLAYSTATVISTSTVFSLPTTDPVGHGVAAGVRQVLLSKDGGSYVPYSTPFVLPSSGTHSLAWRGIDNVGNTSAIQTASVTVFVDTVAPVTQIGYSTSTYTGAGNQIYLSSSTSVHFSATDTGRPLSGVAFTQYSLDASTVVVRYSVPFVLAEGLHTIKFQSRDNNGNLEALHISTVAVDATPPAISLAYSSSTVISTGTLFALTGTDPAAHGVSSGLHQILVAKDGGAYAVYSAPFVLASSGTHALSWRATDNIGNSSAVQTASLTVFVDTVPPVTQLGFSTSTFAGPSGQVDISSFTTLRFSAADAGKPLSGLAYTQYEIDASTTFVHYVAPLILAEGVHAVKYQSRDNNGNLETLHISTVAVDATPPAVTLHYSTGTAISTSTVFSFSAADPVTRSVASGVRQILLSRDNSAFIVSPASFVFSSTGTHIIAWRAVDNVGNTSVVQSTTIVVAAFMAQSSLKAPMAILISPAPALVGMDSVFTPGALPVTAMVESNALSAAAIQVAPAQEPDTAFRSVAGTPATLSGQLTAMWDTSGLSGFYKVRVLAKDTNGQTAESRTTVYLGSPKIHWRTENATTSSGAEPVLVQPEGVHLDELGNVFVASRAVPKVVKLDTSGRFVETTDSSPYFPTKVARALAASSMSTSAGGYRYVIDPATQQVHKYDAQKNLVASFGSDLAIKQPAGLAVDAQSNLYLTDREQNRVYKIGAPQEGLDTQINSLNVVGGGSGVQFPSTPVSGSSPNSAFEWGDVFVFPNPARNGASPTLHAEIGIVDRITFKIYNIAGQELNEAELDQPPAIIDAGQGPRYAYEYVWTGHIASAVYFYIIDAEKSETHKTKRGKFSVIR